MRMRRISGSGCIILAIIALVIASLIGSFTLAILRLLFRTPIGWVLLVALIIFFWRRRNSLGSQRVGGSSFEISRTRRESKQEYVTLDEDPEVEKIQDE